MLAAHVARQPEGNRNNALFWAACRAAEAGITDYQPLIDAGNAAGLTAHQAAQTVRSAQKTIGRACQPAAALERSTPTSSAIVR